MQSCHCFSCCCSFGCGCVEAPPTSHPSHLSPPPPVPPHFFHRALRVPTPSLVQISLRLSMRTGSGSRGLISSRTASGSRSRSASLRVREVFCNGTGGRAGGGFFLFLDSSLLERRVTPFQSLYVSVSAGPIAAEAEALTRLRVHPLGLILSPPKLRPLLCFFSHSSVLDAKVKKTQSRYLWLNQPPGLEGGKKRARQPQELPGDAMEMDDNGVNSAALRRGSSGGFCALF